jgi:hypothetical protein
MSLVSSLARVVTFPRLRDDTCISCGQPRAAHLASGRWVGCSQDRVIGQDQHTAERRLRLALLQARVRRVRPFGIGE